MRFRLRRRCTLPPRQVWINLRKTARYAGRNCDPLQNSEDDDSALLKKVVKAQHRIVEHYQVLSQIMTVAHETILWDILAQPCDSIFWVVKTPSPLGGYL